LQPVDLRLAPDRQIIEVPVFQLEEHPFNKTIYQDTSIEGLTEFVESIRAVGIREPIQVQPTGRILSGHRRLKAAKLLGLKTVPVIVRFDVVSEATAKYILVLHNIHQRDKTRLERIREIEAYCELASGVRNLDIKTNGNGKWMNQSQFQRADCLEGMSQEDMESIRNELKAFQAEKALSLNQLAGKKFGVGERNLARDRAIYKTIMKLRNTGYDKEADELADLLNRNPEQAKYQSHKYRDYVPRKMHRTAEQICTKMVKTAEEQVLKLVQLLSVEGQEILQRIRHDLKRLPLHLDPKVQKLLEEDETAKVEELWLGPKEELREALKQVQDEREESEQAGQGEPGDDSQDGSLELSLNAPGLAL